MNQRLLTWSGFYRTSSQLKEPTCAHGSYTRQVGQSSWFWKTTTEDSRWAASRAVSRTTTKPNADRSPKACDTDVFTQPRPSADTATVNGVRILRDPYLLLRFLRIRLVSQPMPVFAAFFLDRKQRLIRFAELTHGSGDQVDVYPKEVVRDTLQCGAEQVLCVRSDPRGDHQPTSKDCTDARRVKYALSLIEVPLVDYIIVGESVTSLVHRRVI